jgi:hypothetical protein
MEELEALYGTPLRNHAIGAQRQHGQQRPPCATKTPHRFPMPIRQTDIGARLHGWRMFGIDRIADHRPDRRVQLAFLLFKRLRRRRGRGGWNGQFSRKARQQVGQFIDPHHRLGLRLYPVAIRQQMKIAALGQASLDQERHDGLALRIGNGQFPPHPVRAIAVL